MGAVLGLAITGLFFLESDREPQQQPFVLDAILRAATSNDQHRLAAFVGDDFTWSIDGTQSGGKAEILTTLEELLIGVDPFMSNVLSTDKETGEMTLRFLCGTVRGNHQNPTVHPIVKTILVDLTLHESNGNWQATEAVLRSNF